MLQKQELLSQHTKSDFKTWVVSLLYFFVVLLMPRVANSSEYWIIERPQADAIFMRQLQPDESKSVLGTFAFEIACLQGNLLVSIYSRKRNRVDSWQSVVSFDDVNDPILFKGKYEKIGSGKNTAYVFTFDKKSAKKLIAEMKLTDQEANLNKSFGSGYDIAPDEISPGFTVMTTEFRRIAAELPCLR